MISKKILLSSLFTMSTSLTLTMQKPQAPQKSFSKLALGQSAALCGFGALTFRAANDLNKTFDHTVAPIQRSICTHFKILGKSSITLGLLSAIYIMISNNKNQK